MALEIRREAKSIAIRNPDSIPVLSFIGNGTGFQSFSEERIHVFDSRDVEIIKSDGATEIKISLDLADRIYGLGEKPGRMERNRSVHSVYSMDAWNYNRKMKDIYSSFPSFIVVSTDLMEVFVNCGSEITFDFGVSDYNMITIRIPAEDFEFFMATAASFHEIMEWHSSLTGRPFKLPAWVLGHQVSRWSYYPQRVVEYVRDSYLREFPPFSPISGHRLYGWIQDLHMGQKKVSRPGKTCKGITGQRGKNHSDN